MSNTTERLLELIKESLDILDQHRDEIGESSFVNKIIKQMQQLDCLIANGECPKCGERGSATPIDHDHRFASCLGCRVFWHAPYSVGPDNFTGDDLDMFRAILSKDYHAYGPVSFDREGVAAMGFIPPGEFKIEELVPF